MIIVIGSEKLSLVEVEAFLGASESVGFAGGSGAEVYRWSQALLCHHEYGTQPRRAKGLIRAYMERMTGLSRVQCARLIGQYRKSGRVTVGRNRRHTFPRRYTGEDVAALARVDQAHERLSGPATRHILKREFEVYGKAEFERLATISNGHLYNLRHSAAYRQKVFHYEKTRPVRVLIGERRKPAPNGVPGYLRIDTVHQGDGPQGKGLYHINAVDEVTQWEIVAATPFISEGYLLPVLEALLRQFPFRVLGFHTDNGSEFINRTVAKLLGKLLIEQTKSRARHSGDNGLVETKNAAIVRKYLGFGHIAPGGDAYREAAHIKGLATMVDDLVGAAPHSVAVVSFGNDPDLVQDFTSNPAQISDAFSQLQPCPEQNHNVTLDVVKYASQFLQDEPVANSRKVILLVSETRDHGSKTNSSDVIAELGSSNTVVESVPMDRRRVSCCTN
jgi:transposase InsO family protein